ncbi:MAG TPA: DUF1707 domain-containing protein [Streptosporangiaceae bacterium]|nr:DUF1707 domain-containing protein [Streptosporangiaceae bacterium]
MDENMLRVSDADRDAAISELGEHFQAGRLDPAELEDRTGRALRARIGSDLDELLADLPRGPQAPARPQPPARRRPALVPFAIPLLVAAGLTAVVLTAASGGGWHHQWALGWALWWVVPVLAMRMLWWRRFGGARPWR